MPSPTPSLPTDPATGRPIYKGLVVPWVVQWSAERLNLTRTSMRIERDVFGEVKMIGFRDPFVFGDERTAMAAQRDSLGLLWFRYRNNAHDVGEPLFADLHATRQCRTMTERLCQVCGKPFENQPVTFLLSREAVFAAVESEDAGRIKTWTSPTCATCIPVAMRDCPAQRRSPRMVITAYQFHPHAVRADLITADPSSTEVNVTPNVVVPLGNPATGYALCKQLGVSIADYTAKPLSDFVKEHTP